MWKRRVSGGEPCWEWKAETSCCSWRKASPVPGVQRSNFHRWVVWMWKFWLALKNEVVHMKCVYFFWVYMRKCTPRNMHTSKENGKIFLQLSFYMLLTIGVPHVTNGNLSCNSFFPLILYPVYISVEHGSWCWVQCNSTKSVKSVFSCCKLAWFNCSQWSHTGCYKIFKQRLNIGSFRLDRWSF